MRTWRTRRQLRWCSGSTVVVHRAATAELGGATDAADGAFDTADGATNATATRLDGPYDAATTTATVAGEWSLRASGSRRCRSFAILLRVVTEVLWAE